MVIRCLNRGGGLKETLPSHELYPAPGDTRGETVSVLCPHVAHHTSRKGKWRRVKQASCWHNITKMCVPILIGMFRRQNV